MKEQFNGDPIKCDDCSQYLGGAVDVRLAIIKDEIGAHCEAGNWENNGHTLLPGMYQ